LHRVERLQVVSLADVGGDERGLSFAVPREHLDFVGTPKDTHVATLLSGHTRGNHFHVERRELLLILYQDRWSLHWDSGPETLVETRAFSGTGAAAVSVPQHTAHAVTNDGTTPLWIVAVTDGEYDPENPDAHPRVVTRDDRGRARPESPI
jgi:dTDP-4-dehydrorhamnose 3,5-epimerase-like enzyme